MYRTRFLPNDRITRLTIDPEWARHKSILWLDRYCRSALQGPNDISGQRSMIGIIHLCGQKAYYAVCTQIHFSSKILWCT